MENKRYTVISKDDYQNSSLEWDEDDNSEINLIMSNKNISGLSERLSPPIIFLSNSSSSSFLNSSTYVSL